MDDRAHGHMMRTAANLLSEGPKLCFASSQLWKALPPESLSFNEDKLCHIMKLDMALEARDSIGDSLWLRLMS